jgi:hypothetical protein
MTRQPLGGLGRLIVRVFTILWTRDQPVAETAVYTTHNAHKSQTSMPPARVEPTIPVSEWPQTHTLDRAVTGIGIKYLYNN